MSKNHWSHWISLSDMMTGLMLVFLLISLLVITVVEEMKEELELQKQQLETQKKKIDDVEKQKNRILLEYNNAKADILKDLKKAFEDKEIEWDMTIDDDLTIKFNNPDVLFEANKSIIKSEFKIILNNFIPKYLEIINSEKYKDKIKEVRIEWHASWPWCTNYLVCLDISQSRANSVLRYMYNNSYFKLLNNENKEKLEFIFTSNGMSDWKNLDKNGEYIYYSDKIRDDNISRRVEFRIVSNSEELIEDLLDKINK